MPGTPATTPRLAVPRYDVTDSADPSGPGPATIFNQIIDAFDLRALRFDSGLASARPAAGVAGRFYHSTDTGDVDYDNGSAWQWVMKMGGSSGFMYHPDTEALTGGGYSTLGFERDRVTGIVHPQDGIMTIHYDALWRFSDLVGTPGNALPPGWAHLAAIFINGVQLKLRAQDPDPAGSAPPQFAVLNSDNGSGQLPSKKWFPLGTTRRGLQGGTALIAFPTDTVNPSIYPVGSWIGIDQGAGAIPTEGNGCDVWLTAGTYDVEILFAGTTLPLFDPGVIKERKLWVESRAF